MSNNPFNEQPSYNPYAASGSPYSPPPQGPPMEMENGFIKQVMVVGILTIIQGVLELIMGGFLAFFSVMMGNMDQFQNPRQANGMDENMSFYMMLGYGIIAGVVILLAFLRIVAGIGLIKYRMRTLGIVTAVLGLGTSLTCYCGPTSIALAVYTLVVLLQGPVQREFERRRLA